ncbi:hypothetical protein KR222_000433 [Zaprionus bogoriensis]|nr:hypothetical protein KR222_000433 [Zaprionus bogoriensis]
MERCESLSEMLSSGCCRPLELNSELPSCSHTPPSPSPSPSALACRETAGGSSPCSGSNCKDCQDLNVKCLKRMRCWSTRLRRAGRQRKKSERELWLEANSNVVMALARHSRIDPVLVFSYLYEMTLEKFSRALHPHGSSFKGCDVPLSNFDSCDYYTAIFDRQGNIRFPLHPRAFFKLRDIMRDQLKPEGDQQDNGTSGLYGRDSRHDKVRGRGKAASSQRDITGLGKDSQARENGRRRRFEYEYGNELEPKEEKGDCTRTPSNLGGGYDVDEEFSWKLEDIDPNSDYGKFLDMAMKLKQGGATDADNLAKIIKGMRAKEEQMEARQRRASALKVAKKLSRDYNSKASKIRLNSMQDSETMLSYPNDIDMNGMDGMNGMNGMRDMRGMRGMNGMRGMKGFDGMDGMDGMDMQGMNTLLPRVRQKPRNAIRRPKRHNIPTHYYYGAQIPILMHGPFNPDQPESWMRRHPRNWRLADRGSIVRDKPINRYKRQSVAARLAEIRLRMSVRSEVGDIMYGEAPRPAESNDVDTESRMRRVPRLPPQQARKKR